MFGSDNFQIRHGQVEKVGEFAPSGSFTNLLLGTPLKVSDYVAKTAVLATITAQYLGFIDKDVTTAGPDTADMLLGVSPLPAKKGQKVSLYSIQDGGVLEVEGLPGIGVAVETAGFNNLLVTTGTGDVSAATGGEKLAIQDGRWRIAQTGDIIAGIVLDALTPVTASNKRFAIQIVKSETLAV